MMNREIYTGNLMYKDIYFTFIYYDGVLKLVPQQGQEYLLERELYGDNFVSGILRTYPLYRMEDPFLIGTCNETRQQMVFVTRLGARVSSINAVLHIKIAAYINYRLQRDRIDRMCFRSYELDAIHPVNESFSFDFEEPGLSKGIMSVTAKDFDSTTTEKNVFQIEDKEVAVQFSVTRSSSHKIGEPPLTLSSVMFFEFEATDDFLFIYKLWMIAKQFIQYLCYRKNVYFPEVELSCPVENGLHESFATLYVIQENTENTELDSIRKGRVIQQKYIAGCEGKILTDIANNLMYNRHIPEKTGQSIDASRFIMITGAFEWEFRRLYPEGVPRSKKNREIEEIAESAIQDLIANSAGRLKKKYQFLKKLLKSDSLQNEILQVGKDYDDIIGKYGSNLYRLNKFELKYSEMGQRLASQRNHFAHGDLDKDFIGYSLLDLIYMQYIVYAMQLRYYGVSDQNIRRAINELFGLNYYFNDNNEENDLK